MLAASSYHLNQNISKYASDIDHTVKLSLKKRGAISNSVIKVLQSKSEWKDCKKSYCSDA